MTACALIAIPLSAQGKLPPPKPEEAIVKGRCIAAETRAPLAGCTVQFSGVESNASVVALHGEVHWKAPAAVTTSDDGAFEIRFFPPPSYQHFLEVEALRRSPRTARWGAFHAGQVEDLGDIALAVGAMVGGRVVDQDGKPVAGATVSISGMPLPILAGMAANDSRGSGTAPDGSFTIREALPPGHYAFAVHKPGVALVEPRRIDVVVPTTEVLIRIRQMPSIQGLVVDDAGKPVADVYVETDPGGTEWATACWTKEPGTFVIYSENISPDKVRIMIEANLVCEPVQTEGLVRWGTTGVKLQVRRTQSFPLTVVDDTHQPVSQFSLRCFRADVGGDSRMNGLRLGEHHAGGKVKVDGLYPGENILQVVPRDPSLAPSQPVWITITSGPNDAVEVELRRMKPLFVTVRNADASPAKDVQVLLIEMATKPVDRDLLDFPARASFSWSWPPQLLPQVLSSCDVDADGPAKLYGLASDRPLQLVVRRKGVTVHTEAFTCPADDRVVIDLPR